MTFDAYWLTPGDPGSVPDYGFMVLGQEYEDAYAVSAAEAEAAIEGAIESQLDAGYTGPIDAASIAGWFNLPAPTPQLIQKAQAAYAAANQGGTTTVSPTTPTPSGTLETMQAQLTDLESRVQTIEQREALTNDAVAKLAAIAAVFQPSAPVTGPSGPAADADAIAGGQPVVEQQIAQDQAANP